MCACGFPAALQSGCRRFVSDVAWVLSGGMFSWEFSSAHTLEVSCFQRCCHFSLSGYVGSPLRGVCQYTGP